MRCAVSQPRAGAATSREDFARPAALAGAPGGNARIAPSTALAWMLQCTEERESMSKNAVTVSDLAALIHAKEETRAELHLLAVRAYEQWFALEAKLIELEQRLDHSRNDLSQAQQVPSPDVAVSSTKSRS